MSDIFDRSIKMLSVCNIYTMCGSLELDGLLDVVYSLCGEKNVEFWKRFYNNFSFLHFACIAGNWMSHTFYNRHFLCRMWHDKSIYGIPSGKSIAGISLSSVILDGAVGGSAVMEKKATAGKNVSNYFGSNNWNIFVGLCDKADRLQRYGCDNRYKTRHIFPNRYIFF